mgnify:CR=1 FL=1
MSPLRSFALALAASAPLFASPHAMPPLDTRGIAAAEAGAITAGGIVPNFRLTDHRGVTRELYYDTTAKATVLVFTSAGSPRAVQTAAALRALRARFSASDVIIWQIDANASATTATVGAQQTLTNNDTPALLDTAQLVASELGVTRELETFVIGAMPFSILAYRGPLDNAAPATPEPSALTPAQIAELQAQAAKAAEHWERLLRTTADFDNYKKRAAREKQDAIKYANESLVGKIIPVLDNFEMALAAAQNSSAADIKSLQDGVAMIHSQLKSTLTDAGLEEVDATGKPFDPNMHEAVSQQESDKVAEGHVLQQLRKGYKLRERLLRPATVIVAKKPEAKA